MTPAEIIAMAKEAGAAKFYPDHQKASKDTYLVTAGFVERFAALVAAKEREAILDEWNDCIQSDLECGTKFANERAATDWKKNYPSMHGFYSAIRARGEHP